MAAGLDRQGDVTGFETTEVIVQPFDGQHVPRIVTAGGPVKVMFESPPAVVRGVGTTGSQLNNPVDENRCAGLSGNEPPVSVTDCARPDGVCLGAYSVAFTVKLRGYLPLI